MSFFERVGGGNPLHTRVGQLIEQATDGSLASENWGLNMEICDIINETDEGPKDAIKALKKRLSANVGKNYQVVMYALTVLETAVKNCGRRFHMQIASKDFQQELIKIIGPKNDPPHAVQDKILSLIQTWADAFRGIPELKEVEKQYIDLKKKGIEFPMTDLDKMAPIHTPARTSAGSDPPPTQHYPPQRTPQSRANMQPPPPMAPVPMPANSGPIQLNPEQLAKLTTELDTVSQNSKVFHEMLAEMIPGQEEPSDLELLQELNRTCRQMQQRIVELLDKVANEGVTNELLRVNDDLNNAFLRYERFERYRQGQANQQQSNTVNMPPSAHGLHPPAAEPEAATGDTATANLIDLDTPQPSTQTSDSMFAPPAACDISAQLASMKVEDSVSQQLGAINSTPAAAAAGPPDEFDMFAQSRQSFDTYKANPVGEGYNLQDQSQSSASLGVAAQLRNDDLSTYDTLKLGEQVRDLPDDFDEMESWLNKNTSVSDGKESATSAEFDKFLAERAKEAENLPDLPSCGTNNTNSRRQMQKDDADNALFAL